MQLNTLPPPPKKKKKKKKKKKTGKTEEAGFLASLKIGTNIKEWTT